ncbi:hypothetical protein HZL62_004102 [Salmonella enterica]|nr:hypothetical protein [Salmonella enterica]
MPVLISGVLKDGTGTPVQNCTIQLKACRTSTTVVVNTVASENPDDAGRYSMDVEQGQYTVTLLVEGYQRITGGAKQYCCRSSSHQSRRGRKTGRRYRGRDFPGRCQPDEKRYR